MTISTPSPLARKSIAAFALQACLLALLIGWWPTPRALYPRIVHAHAAALLSTGSHQVVLRAGDGESDTVMEGFRASDHAPLWRAELSLLRIGWWPSAVLIALVLATPMTTRRRVLAVCAALLWIELYVLLRLGTGTAFASFEARNGPGTELAGPLHALLRAGAEVLEGNGVLIAVVLLGWVLVARPAQAFELRDFRRRLLPQPRAAR